MRARLQQLRRRLHGQRGAYVLEYTITLVTVLLVMLLTVQVIALLLQGIIFNHALGIASQHAAARGGVDASVVLEFRSRMPRNLQPKLSATTSTGTLLPYASASGTEPTVFGEVFCVTGSYRRSAPFLQLLGVSGRDQQVGRTITVSSQSSRESATLNPDITCDGRRTP